MPFYVSPDAPYRPGPVASALVDGIADGSYLLRWASATAPMFGLVVDDFIRIVQATPHPPGVYVEHPEDGNLLYLAAMCRFLADGHVPRGSSGHFLLHPPESYQGVTMEVRHLAEALTEWAVARRGHVSAFALNSHLKSRLGPAAGMGVSLLAARCAAIIEYGLTPPKSRKDPDDPTKGTPLREELNQAIARVVQVYPDATRGRVQSRLKAERGPVSGETLATLPDRIALVRSLWPC